MVMTSLSTRSGSDFKTCRKLDWNINCSDDSADEEQLNSLVRESYLKHLKRNLIRNYEKCTKTNISIDEVNSYSDMLEKKALRACMVTSIYQRTMAKIIKEIKEATLKETLYDGFRKQIDLFQKVNCDKETQTFIEDPENKKGNICEEVLLNNNNSNSSFSNSKTLFLETFGETEAEINMKLEKNENGIDTYEELLNILLSSPKDTNPLKTKPEDIENSEGNNHFHKKRKLLNGIPFSCDEKEAQPKMLGTSDMNNDIHNTGGPTCPSAVANKDNHKINENFKFNSSLLVNWSYELLVQNTHLDNIISKLKPHKRVIVEKRFKDLFGNEMLVEQNKKHANISEEELSSCRKRIARIIVGELTPFYIDGKIGSRPVFKNLAKKLTDDILCTTLTPDPESIRNTVRGLFIDGKQINSLKDLF